MVGGPGACSPGKFFNLDPLKSLEICKFLVIPSKVPEICITILHMKLDGIFISPVIFVEYNY